MKIKLELEINDTDIRIIVESIIEAVQEKSKEGNSFSDILKGTHF